MKHYKLEFQNWIPNPQSHYLIHKRFNTSLDYSSSLRNKKITKLYFKTQITWNTALQEIAIRTTIRYQQKFLFHYVTSYFKENWI